jgi:hypothetical protein
MIYIIFHIKKSFSFEAGILNYLTSSTLEVLLPAYLTARALKSEIKNV